MADTTDELITLDPRDTTEHSQNVAARPTTLDGKVVGLLSNNKPNSEGLLLMVADLLREKYGVSDVIEANKGTHRIPAPTEMLDDLASRCDVVITATAE